MIKRITEPNDLIHIVKSADAVEEEIPYDRSSWIQWLYQVCKNPVFGLFVEVEEGETLSYIVSVCAKVPPISNSIQIIYFYQKEDSLVLLDEVINWAKELKIPSIEMLTRTPERCVTLGFEIKHVVVERKI